jgi:uncharacterized integral membrane protein
MQPVEMKFLFLERNLPGALLLFLTFSFGFIAGLLVMIRFESKSEKKREVASGSDKK